ncbi:cation:proton antiporter [Candidatus Woesearchaeota archaeon]|nr:cation:proton antiporter [Candidatus Woesearchaeota archaeon]
MNYLLSFGVVILVMLVLSFLVKLMKQPIIVGYVLAGLFFAYYQFKSVDKSNFIIFSELGIAFLLFLMGLEFDLKSLKYTGKDLLISSLIQTIAFFAIAFLITLAFPLSFMERALLAVTFLFSSTLLVAKWLEDKKEIQTLSGKVILTTLILQDILAILILTVMNFSSQEGFFSMILIPFKGILLVIISIVLAKYALNKPLQFSSRYPELLFLCSLGVCFFFIIIAPTLGYSTTVGAFIAGLTLANTQYKTDIVSRLKPLIIFFNMLFFFSLGFQMKFDLSMSFILLLFLFLVANFIIKPLVIYLSIRIRGYDTKTSLQSGIYLCQFSEFGIIIVSSVSFLNNPSLNSIVLLGLVISMILSSYVIKYDRQLLAFILPFLNKYDKIRTREIPSFQTDKHFDVLFFGYPEYMERINANLRAMGKSICVIENDPAKIELMKSEKIDYIYGSIYNPYFFEHLHMKNVELILSEVVDIDATKAIIKYGKNANPKCIVMVTSKTLRESIELYEAGADYVIYPTYINDNHISLILEDYTKDIGKIITKKINEVNQFKELQTKNELITKPTFSDIDSFLGRIKKVKKQKDKKDPNRKHNFYDIDSFFARFMKKQPPTTIKES